MMKHTTSVFFAGFLASAGAWTHLTFSSRVSTQRRHRRRRHHSSLQSWGNRYLESLEKPETVDSPAATLGNSYLESLERQSKASVRSSWEGTTAAPTMVRPVDALSENPIPSETSVTITPAKITAATASQAFPGIENSVATKAAVGTVEVENDTSSITTLAVPVVGSLVDEFSPPAKIATTTVLTEVASPPFTVSQDPFEQDTKLCEEQSKGAVEATNGAYGSSHQLSNEVEREVAPVDSEVAKENNAGEKTSEVQTLMKQVKEAGTAGIISYALWELGFWLLSVPVVLLGYVQFTGHFPDFSNQDDLSKLGAEAFAFVNLARFAVPLRIGLALSTTPWIQKNVLDRFFAKEDLTESRSQ